MLAGETAGVAAAKEVLLGCHEGHLCLAVILEIRPPVYPINTAAAHLDKHNMEMMSYDQLLENLPALS